MKTKHLFVGLAVGLLLTSVVGLELAAQEATGLATVHLADGTSVPLRDWSLSYEFTTRDKDAPAFQAATEYRPTKELWVDKKAYPVTGKSLEIIYHGVPTRVKELRLKGEKDKKLKLKKPHKERLAPEADKRQVILPQSLELKGETLMGTKRSFCVLSFSALIQCFSEPSQQVTGVEFE